MKSPELATELAPTDLAASFADKGPLGPLGPMGPFGPQGMQGMPGTPPSPSSLPLHRVVQITYREKLLKYDQRTNSAPFVLDVVPSLTASLPHCCTAALPHSLTHSPTHSLTHTHTQSHSGITAALSHCLTHSLTHSLTHTHTLNLTVQCVEHIAQDS